jgi:putative FmdB family regulatory protein
MPTYEYKCDKCDHLFEVYQSMKDDKLTKCPECGKKSLRRLIGTGSGLIFKGSGFYLTDYKNKPSEKKASSASGANTDSKSSGNSGSGKNESKTEDTKTTDSKISTDSKSETSKSNTVTKDTNAKAGDK